METGVAVAPIRLLHSFGTFAYSVSPSGAKAAIEYCLPLRNRLITFADAGVCTPDEGVDISLCGLYPSIRAYLALPFIAMVQDHGSSDRLQNDRSCAIPDVSPYLAP